MKIVCNKNDLMRNISIVQKAVSNNKTVDILNGILIEALDNDKIMFTGYDLQTGIRAEIDAEVQEKGSIVVSSNMFGDIVRKLPEDDVIISYADNVTEIECGSANFKIPSMDPDNFPRIPEVEENTSDKIIISQVTLKRMINNTSFAISKDNSRPVLTGANIVSDGSSMSVVALDGFRMAINKEDMGNGFPIINYIVPGKAIDEMGKILSDEEDSEVIIYTSMQNLLFDLGNVKMVSRLIDGNFINFNSIITKNPKSVMIIDRKALYEAADRASLIIKTEERKCPLHLFMSDPDVLTIKAQALNCMVDEKIDVTVEGDLVDIDLNCRFLLDALKNISDDTIRVEVNGALGPCIIKPCEGDSYTYLILPIRR